MNAYLSKSKYLVALQCEKRLWLEVNRRDLLPPIPPVRQRVFDQGHEVGRLARGQFPEGILIDDTLPKWDDAVAATAAALDAGATTVFEPSFSFGDTIARADAMVKLSDGSFDLTEVKSTTGSKPEHVFDLAVQAWVYEGCGLRIAHAFLMHLNKKCRHPDLSNLFAVDDLTDGMRRHIAEVPANIARFKAVLDSEAEPARRLGSHCSSPYECSFFGYCSKLWNVPEPSVFNIPHLGAEKRDELIERGILGIEDIPADADIGSQGARFVQLHLSQSKKVDKPAIARWIEELAYPLWFIDFETDSPAVPRFEGLGPYGTVPFQFSLHVMHADGTVAEAPGYLHLDADDPRPGIAGALLEQIGPEGSLIAYNASFERRVIGQLATFLPPLAKRLQALQPRFADLLDVFRNHYIDPAFGGSNSIKRVLPVICPDLGYDGLEVRNGEEAQAIWSKLISSTDEAERSALAKGLRAYCGLDTFAMVRLFQFLKAL
jgi:hypothetical protein